jgi:hypothetical protein
LTKSAIYSNGKKYKNTNNEEVAHLFKCAATGMKEKIIQIMRKKGEERNLHKCPLTCSLY